MNLWQVTILSQLNREKNKKPEEIFLLNSIQQLITGKTYQDHFNREVDFIKFVFKEEGTQPVYIVLDNPQERKKLTT